MGVTGLPVFPHPFRVKSDLCITEEVWKIAVLSTAHGAEGSGAQMWQAWLCFPGNLLFKGCLAGFQLVMRQKRFSFPKCLTEKILPNRKFASLKRLLELYAFALGNQW